MSKPALSVDPHSSQTESNLAHGNKARKNTVTNVFKYLYINNKSVDAEFTLTFIYAVSPMHRGSVGPETVPSSVASRDFGNF